MPSVPLHIVFSAECNPLFDWHSVGLFHSFGAARQHGNMTRLLACSEKELGSYPRTNLAIGSGVGNTFVHRNMRNDPLVDEVGYPSYNKPYSVMAWLEQTHVAEDYVLMMDSDMLLREPLDPVALGVARGRVVSAEYTYLVGTEPSRGFAERFIPKALLPRLAQVTPRKTPCNHSTRNHTACNHRADRAGRRLPHLPPRGPAADRAAVARVHEEGARVRARRARHILP